MHWCCGQVLAAPEKQLQDNWLEYHDDYGRPYYYNTVTNETSRFLPSASPSSNGHSPSPSRSRGPSQDRLQSDTSERDEEAGSAPPIRVSPSVCRHPCAVIRVSHS